jgi:putative flippase GtrA
MSVSKRTIFREKALITYAQRAAKDILPRMAKPHVSVFLWILLGLLMLTGVTVWLWILFLLTGSNTLIGR